MAQRVLRTFGSPFPQVLLTFVMIPSDTRYQAVNTISVKLAIIAATVFLLPTDLVSHVSAAGPGVHGRVLGHDEQGKFLGIVAGAQIEFQNGSHARVASALADPNGYYKVDLPPGEYYYRIHADGYRTEEGGRGMRLSNSQGYAVFNLALTKGQDDQDRKPPVPPVAAEGRLRGRVLEESPNGKSGIGNARITFRLDGSSELKSVYSRSADDGEKQIGDYEIALPVGTYEAAVVAKSFDIFKDPQSIVIEEGKDSERDFILSRTQLAESTGQGVRGVVTLVDAARAEAHPLITLNVVPLHGGDAIPVNVAENGEFSQDLSPGKYRLVANAEGFPETSSRPVYVFSGRYSNVNLALRAGRVPQPDTSLEVLIVGKSPGTEKAVPLSGAMVSIIQEGGDAESATEAQTDETGHAFFVPRDAGKLRIDAHAAGFQGKTSEFDIALGERKSVTLELSAEAAPATQFTMDVTITDALTKMPLAGVKILARHADDALARSSRSTTDSAGKAEMTVSRTGTYTLLGQAAGYKPEGTKVNVVADQLNYSLSFVMSPILPEVQPEPAQPDDQRPPTGAEPTAPFRVVGFVAYRDAEGQLRGVKGAKLVWERINPAQPPMTKFTVSGENGKYEVTVQKGLHQVRVEPPAGFGTLMEQVQVTHDGQEKYFVVVRSNVKPPGSVENLMNVTGVVVTPGVTGHVTGVKGAEILFMRTAGVANAEAGDGGEFQIRLPMDSYRVLVRANGFEPFETPVRVVADMQPLRLMLKRMATQTQDFRLSLTAIQKAERLGYGPARTIAGAEISIIDAKKTVINGVTNRAGQYSVRLQPGMYTVRAARTGFRPESIQLNMPARDLNEQIVLAPTEMQPPATQFALTVRVFEHQDVPALAKAPPVPRPINGAAVTVIRGSQVVASGTTSGQGQYVIQLPSGDYSVKASAAGFAPAGKTVSLAGKNANVNFELTKRTSRLDTGPGLDLRRRNNPVDAGKQGVNEPFILGKARRITTTYVVEYRLKEGSPWQEYGRYSTTEQAQQALNTAVKQRRIPRGAATRIELKTGG